MTKFVIWLELSLFFLSLVVPRERWLVYREGFCGSCWLVFVLARSFVGCHYCQFVCWLSLLPVRLLVVIIARSFGGCHYCQLVFWSDILTITTARTAVALVLACIAFLFTNKANRCYLISSCGCGCCLFYCYIYCIELQKKHASPAHSHLISPPYYSS